MCVTFIHPQFHHVIDILPAILTSAGMHAPAGIKGVPQKPIDGVILAYTLDIATAPSKHKTQYFEMLGNRDKKHGDSASSNLLQRTALIRRRLTTTRAPGISIKSQTLAVCILQREKAMLIEIADYWT